MEPTTNSQHTMLAQPTVLQLLEDDGPGSLVRTELRYDRTDPYAVSLVAFGDDGNVVWIFARDLLADGLEEPAGDGDVHVWPGEDEDGRPMILIELISGDADAILAARPADIAAFVRASHQMVPPGAESGSCDVDALIAALLAGVPNADGDD